MRLHLVTFNPTPEKEATTTTTSVQRHSYLVIALGGIVLLLIASGIGVIPLGLAVVLHEGCTIVVILNALRLLAWHELSTI